MVSRLLFGNDCAQLDWRPVSLELVEEELLPVFQFFDLRLLGGDLTVDDAEEFLLVKGCFVIVKGDNHLVVFCFLVDVDELDGGIGVAEVDSGDDDGWEFFERFEADDDPVEDLVAGVFFLEELDTGADLDDVCADCHAGIEFKFLTTDFDLVCHMFVSVGLSEGD